MTLDTFKSVVVEKIHYARKEHENAENISDTSYWNGYIQAVEDIDFLLMQVTADTEKTEGKKSLYEKMKETIKVCQEYLPKQDGCLKCPYGKEETIIWCNLISDVSNKDLDKIPEEYR